MTLHPLLKTSLVIGLLALQYPLHAKQTPHSDCRWTTIDATGEPTGRHENGFIEYKGKFYLIGGRGTNPVNVFDPATNTWTEKGKTPIVMHHFQPVIYGDAIYVVGAMQGGYPEEPPLEHVWIYYPETDTWEQGPEIPETRRRGGAGAAVYQDKIYMACGITLGHTSGTNNLFDSFDPRTGEWEVLPMAPHIRDHFPAIVVGDKLYCIGGRNTSVHTPKSFGAFFDETEPAVDVYDFTLGKWHTMNDPLPFPAAAGGLVHMDNALIYMGGEGQFRSAYNTTQRLDLKTGSWSQLPTLSLGRHGSGAIAHDGKIYMAAGSPNKGGGNLSSIEVFSPTHQWKPLFNGKDLEGWSVQCTQEDAHKSFWSVQDGSIHSDSLSSDEHSHVWLVSDAEFSDFELRLKFKSFRATKGNSGVQVRSRYDHEAKINYKGAERFGWLDGPQVDINPNGSWRNGLIYDETQGAQRWISPSLPDAKIEEKKYAPKKVVHYFEDEGPEWNDMRIRCAGTHIQSWVNNILVSDYDGAGILDDQNHIARRVGLFGHIAFQIHTNSKNKMSFKDIEIRELNHD